MDKMKEEIIRLVREEFEHKEKYNDQWEYQWVMGVSMKREGLDKYRIKLVVKTSESTYMDGMEIDIHLIDEKAKLEENYFERTPDIMGNPKDDSIRWLSELGR